MDPLSRKICFLPDFNLEIFKVPIPNNVSVIIRIQETLTLLPGCWTVIVEDDKAGTPCGPTLIGSLSLDSTITYCILLSN